MSAAQCHIRWRLTPILSGNELYHVDGMPFTTVMVNLKNNHMKKIISICLVLASGFYFHACNSPENRDAVDNAEEMNEQKEDAGAMSENTAEDSDFMVKAANAGLAEVEMGNVAQQNAADQQVKDFASKMVRDHTQANTELKTIATTKNVTVPETSDDHHKKMLTDLSGKTGLDFDKEYMRMMVEDHDDAVGMFERAAENANDPDVRAFAAKTLPVLRQHQEEAKNIHEAIKDRK